MKKMLLGFAAFLLIGLLAACNQDEETNEAEEERVTPVETVEATQEDLVIEKSLYARTAPIRSTPVMVQTPGEIDTLEVENGDQVEEDDLIATISTPAGKQNIRASKDGEITNLQGTEGDAVTNEEPLAVIADMDTVKLDFTVTADVHSLFEKEDKFNVVIADKEYEAEITSINTMPDDTGLYPIQANVENEDGDILPGMIAAMYVPEKRVEEAIIVPTEAVVEENDETYLYVVSDNKAVKTMVEIQETQSDYSAIEGDVEAGDQIVVNGQLTLTDGHQVNVVKGE